MTEGLEAKDVNALAGVRAFSISHIGLVRHDNQDSIGVFENAAVKLYAVADGMGGAAGGAHASKIAIGILKEAWQSGIELTERMLGEAVLKAHDIIFTESRRVPGLVGMGTTVVGVAFIKNKVIFLNVGDSRAYLVRAGKISRVTEDHTVVAELLRAGTLSADQTKSTPVSHMLTRSLGAPHKLTVDCYVNEGGLLKGDKILICSDGLHGQVKDEDILQICTSHPAPDVLDLLVKQANLNGGQDNVSVILVEVTDEYQGTSATAADRLELKKVEFVGAEPALPISEAAAEESPQVEPDDADDSAAMGAGPRALAIHPIPALIIVLLCFLLGLVVGVSNPGIYSKLFDWGSAFDEPEVAQSRDANYSNYRERTAPSAVVEGSKAPAIPMVDYSNLSPEELIEHLENVRIRLDVATRKLILWQGRKERLKSGDPAEFASEVSISAPTVRSKLSVYQKAHLEYLREAEVLIYNPADPDQESKVEGLSHVQNAALDDLNREVVRVVDAGISSSLGEITALSRERDKLQSLIQMRHKKDSTEESPVAQPAAATP